MKLEFEIIPRKFMFLDFYSFFFGGIWRRIFNLWMVGKLCYILWINFWKLFCDFGFLLKFWVWVNFKGVFRWKFSMLPPPSFTQLHFKCEWSNCQKNGISWKYIKIYYMRSCGKFEIYVGFLKHILTVFFFDYWCLIEDGGRENSW